MGLLPILPMLATMSTPSLLESLDESQVIEPKLDGIRCIVVCDENGCRLFNRQLKDITHRFPEIRLVPAARNCILDGELVCLHAAVSSAHSIIPSWLINTDFQTMQRRANRDYDIDKSAAEYPARFVAFDVIHLNDANLAPLPFGTRRRFLHTLNLPYAVPWLLATQIVPGTGEGLIIKDLTSSYTPGLRSASWRKIKWEKEDWFYVCGFTPGNGKRRGSYGALLVGSWEDRQGVSIFTYRGEVGTGYSDEDLVVLADACQSRIIHNNIFGVKGPLNATLVVPTIQIKVRFNEYTNTGKLRFPRYADDYRIPDNN